MMATNPLREKMLQLASRLLQKTIKEEIRWSETDDSTTFLYSTEQGGVTIDRYTQTAGQNRVRRTVLAILDSAGREVDTLKFVENLKQPIEGEAELQVLVDLHEQARRSALQIDKVIDSLLEDLG